MFDKLADTGTGMNSLLRRIDPFVMFGLVPALAMIAVIFAPVDSSAKKARAHKLELIMFEQEGCHYCQAWDDDIGVVYDKTPEGKFAPLRKIDIHTDEKLPNVRPVVFTPTFVLYKKGREVGRITGFISEDFFWSMLETMLKKHGFGNRGQEKKSG